MAGGDYKIRGGDHQILPPYHGRDHKITYPLYWGDHKICRVNFAQFFRSPAVKKVMSLKALITSTRASRRGNRIGPVRLSVYNLVKRGSINEMKMGTIRIRP